MVMYGIFLTLQKSPPKTAQTSCQFVRLTGSHIPVIAGKYQWRRKNGLQFVRLTHDSGERNFG
jgi:hypothetical protein